MAIERLSVSVTPEQALFLKKLGLNPSRMLQEATKSIMSLKDETKKEIEVLTRKVKLYTQAGAFITGKLKGTQFEFLWGEALLHANAEDTKEVIS